MMHMAHNNMSNRDVGEGNDITPIQLSKEDGCRHKAFDYRLNCITTNNISANMTMKSRLSPVKGPDKGT